MPLFSRGTQLLDAERILRRVGVTSGAFVADLGCGAAGHFVFPAARLVGGQGKVYAVDIQKAVLDAITRRARVEISAVEAVRSNLEVYGGTKIPEETLDVTLLVKLLCQTKKYEEVMREAFRLTRSKGKILILEWKQEGAPSFAPAIEWRVGPETVRALAQRLNLEEVDDFEAGPYHYAIVFRKP